MSKLKFVVVLLAIINDSLDKQRQQVYRDMEWSGCQRLLYKVKDETIPT